MRCLAPLRPRPGRSRALSLRTGRCASFESLRGPLRVWRPALAPRFRPPYNASFFRHLPADSLELGLRLGGDPRCDTVSHCRAAANSAPTMRATAGNLRSSASRSPTATLLR